MVAVPRGVVFDLDDTLYLERDYVRSGYLAVARAAAIDEADSSTMMDFLWARYESGQRERAFDVLLDRFPVIAESWSVLDLVSVYRQHAPTINMGVAMSALLEELAADGAFLGVVSDGYLSAQTAKSRALLLDRWFAHVILTDRWGPNYWKPSPRAFQEIENVSRLCGASLTYVGDNPKKDFLAPNGMGWNTVRLRTPGQLHWEAPDGPPASAAARTVTTLSDLRDALSALGGS